MKLEITWETPEELLSQIAQVFYIASYSHQDDLNARLARLHGDKPIELELKPEAKAPKTQPAEEKPKPAAKAKEKAKRRTSEEEVKTEPEPQEDAAMWDEVTQPSASMDSLRQAFVKKNTPALRPKLKAILAELGVAKVTELPEESWDEALKKLEDL